MLEKIQKYLLDFLFNKRFVFRFQYYEVDTVINDTNVVEYEFINQGQTLCEINGLQLMPDRPAFPIGTNIFTDTFRRVKLGVYYNELDTTIYRIKFIGEQECTQNCNKLIRVDGWVTCIPAPPSVCLYGLVIKLNTVPVTNQIEITCMNDEASLNVLLLANLLPTFIGVPTITLAPEGMYINIQGTGIPCAVVFGYTVELVPLGGGELCPEFTQTLINDKCLPELPAKNNRLLVIMKVKAGLKDNP